MTITDGFTLKADDGHALRFEPAPMDVEIVDVWPPGRLTDVERAAYDALADAGRIRPTGASRDVYGRVIIRYMADIPAEWIRGELREAKYAGRQLQIGEE